MNGEKEMRNGRLRTAGSDNAGIIVLLFGVAMVIASIAAWFTHIFHCLAEEAWGFLIAGAIMFPIAIIHGVGLWFGAF